MELILEIVQFIIYTGLIVFISKNILVTTLRRLAENLELKPKTVGDIAGIATSVPEFLTICAASFNGLIDASIYNILSSNIINFIQYYLAIIINKNQKAFRNQAIKTDLVLVIMTILLPLILVLLNVDINILIAVIFIFLYIIFKLINENASNLYLQKENKSLEEQIVVEELQEKGDTRKTLKYIGILLVVGILLFFVGNLLGNTIESLCNRFNISQFIIGIILGFVTSLPELITFFESQRHYKNNNQNDILGVVEATNNLLQSNCLNLFIIQSIGIIIFKIVA